MNYKIRKACKSDEKRILELAREITDRFSRKYLGDEAVDWYINSGMCDSDMKADIDNMVLLTIDNEIIGVMIWHDELMHLLLIDIPYHGTGAAKYFCDKIIEEKFKIYDELRLECFDKNERGNSFYIKNGWIEYDRIVDEMTGGNRILYKLNKSVV